MIRPNWDKINDQALYTVFPKTLTFLFHFSFYKCEPIFIIFGTQCTEVICNITIIDNLTCLLYLRTVATLPWEILIFGFWTNLADLFHQQSYLNDFEMWR